LKASKEWFETATFSNNFDCEIYYQPDLTADCLATEDGYINTNMYDNLDPTYYNMIEDGSSEAVSWANQANSFSSYPFISENTDFQC